MTLLTEAQARERNTYRIRGPAGSRPQKRPLDATEPDGLRPLTVGVSAGPCCWPMRTRQEATGWLDCVSGEPHRGSAFNSEGGNG